MIISGGFAPSPEGRFEDDAPLIGPESDLSYHRALTSAVKSYGTPFLMQLLHAGRYASLPDCVAPSPLRAPINRHTPRELKIEDV